MLLPVSIVFAYACATLGSASSPLKPSAGATADDRMSVVEGSTVPVTYTYSDDLGGKTLHLTLNASTNLDIDPTKLQFTQAKKRVEVNVTGINVTSLAFIDIYECSLVLEDTQTKEPCPFNKSDVYVAVAVVRSHVLSILVYIVGWIYFFAWSISFYPQIILNFQRKSVEGLNFDFLLLNVIGFACYTVYNCLQYWDVNIQELYLKAHPRSNSPVLINDVVFAVHALAACIVTGVQCFFYERGNQRVSYICRGWSSVLVLVAIGSLIVSAFDVINYLEFVNILSYIKMAVTLSKYFPQAILNFRRKSTVGWSIGNVLLDFTGGTMDIVQMVLQGYNTNDWSAFVGNKVKFGLGLVSIIFDVVFIIQHYVLYRNSHTDDGSHYDHVDTAETSAVTGRSSTATTTEHTDPVEP